MHSRMGGSTSTLLLSLPLAAVACMAVFGVPQFAPVVASGDDEELSRSGSRRSERSRRDTGDASDAGFFEEFADHSAEAFDEAPAFEQSSRRARADEDAWWTGERTDSRQHRSTSEELSYDDTRSRHAPQSRLADFDADDPRSRRRPEDSTLSDPVRFAENSYDPSSETSRSVTTPGVTHDWQSATRRLSEMGVEKFHLERGHAEGSFLFVCLFEPAGSPQMIRRFEAEAADPLLAVNHVLRQIDDWLKSRYAGRNELSIRTTGL